MSRDRWIFAVGISIAMAACEQKSPSGSVPPAAIVPPQAETSATAPAAKTSGLPRLTYYFIDG